MLGASVAVEVGGGDVRDPRFASERLSDGRGA
jgi:hypothetical protein